MLFREHFKYTSGIFGSASNAIGRFPAKAAAVRKGSYMSYKGILTDKVCLGTGASRGIGRAIAECFAQEGGYVLAGARKEGSLKEWAKEVSQKAPGTVVPLYFDLSDTKSIRDAIVRIKKGPGRVDVLVNNAGMVSNEVLGMISMSRMREMFEVNVFGLTELSQLAATRFMVRQKAGSIVKLASVVGVEGSKGQVAYSASKGAVISITKSMSKELAPHNVRVNAVAPGMIATDRLQATIKEVYKNHIPEIGMKRLGEVKEVADACLYFASDRSSYTTGQILVVGGGNSTLSREFWDICFR